MIKRTLTWFPLLCLGLYSMFSQAESIEFSVVDYPPYILVDDTTNSISGLDVEIVQAAFADQGVDVSFKTVPWKRIIKSMELGLIPGTVSCTKRPNRTDYMLFSEPLSIESRAVVSKTTLDTTSIYEFDDLAAYSLVAIDGWGMQKRLVQQRIPHQASPDLESALNAVRYRNVDLLYMAEYPARYAIKNLGAEQQLKVTLMAGEETLPLHLCVSREYPNAEHIIQTVNAGLEKISANGTLDEIRRKYLTDN